jgi:hypothetical protein
VAYVGLKGDLVALFAEEARAVTDQAVRQVAADAGEAMTRAAVAHTAKRTGNLASKWRTLSVERVAGGYESGTENPDYRALFLEYGTDPHRLAPDDAQALDTPDGPRAAADHPGSRGQHMLARAAAEVEQALEAIAQPTLEAWAMSVERIAD